MLRLFRLTHLYLGLFIAPALLFFAFTGALQTFNLHETHPGSDYKPAKWIVSLSQLHKKQTVTVPPRRSRPAEAQPLAIPATGIVPALPDNAVVHRRSHGETGVPAGQSNAAVDVIPATAALPARPPQKSHLPLKIFFLIVSIGLLVSTLTGIYMAYKYNRSKLIVTALLAAGIVIPLALLPF